MTGGEFKPEVPLMSPTSFWNQIASMNTIFLGILFEATPFLLVGSMASGLIEVFVSQDDLIRLIPNRLIPATVVGGLLGVIFPVCDCGVVPLTRRLCQKGMPSSAGIAFLLAAPILNPIVIVSTYAAYGWGKVFVSRLILGLLVAIWVGLIFSFNRSPAGGVNPVFILNPPEREPAPVPSAVPFGQRLQTALRIAGDDFFSMGRFFILGALLAALAQTILPSKILIAAGSGPLSSVLSMQTLAFMLSVCSTVDAFISLAFVKLFSTGSILSFLVFGPMIDFKSTLMFLGVLRPKMVVYLILLTFLTVALVTVFINVVLGW